MTKEWLVVFLVSVRGQNDPLGGMIERWHLTVPSPLLLNKKIIFNQKEKEKQ
jgi:hypothetical protein